MDLKTIIKAIVALVFLAAILLVVISPITKASKKIASEQYCKALTIPALISQKLEPVTIVPKWVGDIVGGGVAVVSCDLTTSEIKWAFDPERFSKTLLTVVWRNEEIEVDSDELMSKAIEECIQMDIDRGVEPSLD